VSGEGEPGDWRVILESLSANRTDSRFQSSTQISRAVLAQLAQDPTDEHFPVLFYEAESYSNFRLSTRVKMVSGAKEQMGGLAFRATDEQNYYVVRASAMGDSFLFYKFVGGLRSVPTGVNVDLEPGRWYEIAVDCRGNQVRCFLDDQEMFTVTDNTFTSGKVGFWTKSDSVSYFENTRITFTPTVTLADQIVTEAKAKYAKILGLKIYASTPARPEIHIIASLDPEDIDQPGTEIEQDVIANGHVYYGKEKKTVSVTMPLRDRNGDPVAAARLILRRVAGQNRDDAMSRARRVYQGVLQGRVRYAKDLYE